MNKFRYGLIPLMIAAGFGASPVRADDNGDDRRFYVAPMGSYILEDKARGTSGGYGGVVAVGKRVTHGLELELLGTFHQFDTDQSKFSTPQPNSMRLFGGGTGANIYLAPSSEGIFKGLFLHVDVLRGQGRNQPGQVTNYSSTIFDPGLGWDFPLNITLGGLIAPGMTLRTEALYHLDEHNRDIIGTNNSGGQKYFSEAQFNVGLRIPLGGHSKPAEQPAPAPAPEVVPVEQPAAAPPPPPPPAPPPCQPPAPGQPISLEGCKTGDTIVLHGVNFEFNKATLTVNAKTLLDQVADALLARKDIKVEIDGHTDGKGGAAYNQKLSERRAESVKQYLVGRGIDADRMTTKGFGKSMPVADNSTDEGRELNRRVELKVTESAAPAESAPAAAPAEAAPAEAAPAAAPAEAAPAAPAESAPAAPAESAPAAPAEAAPAAPAEAAPAAPAEAAPAPSGDSSTPPAEGSSSSSSGG
ncbi:MAG: OmpA family protein [Nevskia sp.]|nr:OmpA family protein [Nevskia sp.]